MSKSQQFHYKRNRLQQLRGFYFTAQLKSVSAAAKQLSLNQSTVTLQIQSLERDLDIVLFDRTQKQLRLTEDGKTLYRLVVPYIQGMDGIHEQFTKARELEKKHRVDIAAHHIAISYLLPPFIARFGEIYPDVQLYIHNISRSESMERLRAGELDLALYPNSPTPPECYAKISFSYDPVLLMRRDHPLAKREDISLEEIANYNLVRIDPRLITLPLFEEASKTYGWHSNIAFEGGDWEMLKHFVRAKIGIAMVSTLCVDENDPDLIGKSMRKFFPKMEYSIAIKRGRYLSGVTRAFISSLNATFFDELAEWDPTATLATH